MFLLRGLLLVAILLLSARVALYFAEQQESVVRAVTQSGLAPFHDDRAHDAATTDKDVFFEGKHTDTYDAQHAVHRFIDAASVQACV